MFKSLPVAVNIMHRLLRPILMAVLALSGFTATAATWYLSPTGSDSNAGTAASPWRTVEKAQSAGSAGDTVICYGGTYYDSTVNSTDSTYNYVHTITKGMTFSAFPGQVPVFNFTNTPTNLRPVGFNVKAGTPTIFNWIQVTGTPVGTQKLAINFYITGTGVNCTFNDCTAHDSQAIGFYFENHATGVCSNCDSYDNQGTGSGSDEGTDSVGNIDGFGAHGNGVTFFGCRAWNNSDDNYDCINSYGANTFSHCWAYNAGDGGGDGNGFKVGGFGCSGGTVASPLPVHTVEYCLSVRNPGDAGFYANHQPGQAANWIHNTAYDNTVGYNLLEGTGSASTNCSVTGSNEVMHFNLVFGSTYTDIENLNESGAMVSSNSWTETGVTVNTADFLSTAYSQMTNARGADGSLPMITFMHLANGSPLTGLGCFVVPPAPAGLTVAATNTQAALNWTASSGATGYNLKRSLTSGGPYTTIVTNTAATNYTDVGLTNGATYYYVVTALNPGDESAASVQTGVTLAPAAPAGLTATGGYTRVTLNWTPAAGATGYCVKRSTSGAGPYLTNASPATTNYVDSGLSSSSTYYYVVSALNAGGQGSNSAPVDATTITPPPPSFGPAGRWGTNLVFNGTGGQTNGVYYVLTTTNLAAPPTNWTRLLTNPFDGNGNFNFTNPLTTNSPQSFYMLQLP